MFVLSPNGIVDIRIPELVITHRPPLRRHIRRRQQKSQHRRCNQNRNSRHRSVLYKKRMSRRLWGGMGLSKFNLRDKYVSFSGKRSL